MRYAGGWIAAFAVTTLMAAGVARPVAAQPAPPAPGATPQLTPDAEAARQSEAADAPGGPKPRGPGDEAGKPQWSANITAALIPEYRSFSGGPDVTNPRGDVKTRIAETSAWLDFNALLRVERNEADGVGGFPATLVSPAGAYLASGWLTAHPATWMNVYAGKFHSKFAIAALLTPGIFETFAQDYEQTERVGSGVEVTLPAIPVLGPLRVAGEAFFADYGSFASFTRNLPYNPNAGPPYLRVPKGFGPASSGNLDSFALSLRSGRIDSGLFWQVSYTRETTGYAFGRTESGPSATVSYTAPPSDGIRLSSYIEAVHLANYDGVAGLAYNGVNAAVDINRQLWTLSAIAGIRDPRGLYHADDTQMGLALVREIPEFLKGFRFGGGVEHLQINTHKIWVLAPYFEYRVAL